MDKCPKCERTIDNKTVYAAYGKDVCRLCDMLGEEALPAATPSAWPVLSDALAVHPKQLEQVRERNKRHGLGHIEYLPDGRPVLKDRGMRRDLMRLEKVHDKHGGYGD